MRLQYFDEHVTTQSLVKKKKKKLYLQKQNKINFYNQNTYELSLALYSGL